MLLLLLLLLALVLVPLLLMVFAPFLLMCSAASTCGTKQTFTSVREKGRCEPTRTLRGAGRQQGRSCVHLLWQSRRAL